jgi:hypothetical protein
VRWEVLETSNPEQTRGLSLEEINGLFGDTVAVRLTHLTEEEKNVLDATVLQGISGIDQFERKSEALDEK